MNADYTVFVVDNDPTTRLLLESILSDKYPTEAFASAEECLARMPEKRPNLFLLDVDLPGIDGHEFCRRIKADDETRNIPVIFLSAHDDLNAILAGYDAGGEDYVLKPFDVLGLYHKIENLQRIESDKQALAGQAQASDELASLVLANLDEYAVLIKFLRTLNECNSPDELIVAVQNTLTAFHLDGAVQIRMRNFEKTYSKSGENWPLEIAVINHVRTLDRIFEFHQRCAYNFEHITILITDMPVENPELCGRIRDNIAIAAESADAKLAALQSFADNATLRGEIHRLLQALENTVQTYGSQYAQARYQGAIHTTQFLDDLLAAFAHLGMSSQQ
jgi:CheY-like chemotaxis protein